MDLTYRHFRISKDLVVCDWSGGDVGVVTAVNGETRKWWQCSKCNRKLVFNGPERNVDTHNEPDHLGGEPRVELYYKEQYEAVNNYYHPLRDDFDRAFSSSTSKNHLSRTA